MRVPGRVLFGLNTVKAQTWCGKTEDYFFFLLFTLFSPQGSETGASMKSMVPSGPILNHHSQMKAVELTNVDWTWEMCPEFTVLSGQN